MELALRGKIALVGGASEGIGRASAQALVAEGMQVTPCARREAPLRRGAEPGEIAAAAVFFCSAAGGYVTGTPPQADGGLTRCI